MNAMDIRTVMARMKDRGWVSPGGAAPDAIRRIETDFGIALPPDYRTWLGEAGGGETVAPEAITGLWPTSAIHVFNRRYRIPWNFPGLVGIGNDGFLVYAFDFRGPDAPVVSLGVSSSTWDDVVIETDTFTEWLERRLPK